MEECIALLYFMHLALCISPTASRLHELHPISSLTPFLLLLLLHHLALSPYFSYSPSPIFYFRLSTFYFLLSLLYVKTFPTSLISSPIASPSLIQTHPSGRQAGSLPPLEVSKTSQHVSMSHHSSPLLPHRALTHLRSSN